MTSNKVISSQPNVINVSHSNPCPVLRFCYIPLMSTNKSVLRKPGGETIEIYSKKILKLKFTFEYQWTQIVIGLAVKQIRIWL